MTQKDLSSAAPAEIYAHKVHSPLWDQLSAFQSYGNIVWI